MSQDELAVMNGGKCILQLRGVRPFLSDKYDITKHPNYKYLSDANPKNAFDIEKFLSTKLKLKPEEEFEVFDAGAAAGSESAWFGGFLYRSDTHSVKEDADNAADTRETQSRRKAQPKIWKEKPESTAAHGGQLIPALRFPS